MNNVRPIYKQLLILAIVIFVLGVSFMLSDLYYKVMNLEHTQMHILEGHSYKH